MLRPSLKPKESAPVVTVELKDSFRNKRNTRNILSKKASMDIGPSIGSSQ